MSTQANSPAFPRNYDSNGHNGLTTREYFAALAMQGLMANERVGTPKQFAECCVNIADALIEELNKTDEGPKAEAVNPTGVMLEVDGYACSYEEFLRENKELDMVDRERVGDLLRGQSVYLGIQEVKRIQ